MRVLGAIAGLVVGLGAATAFAADIPVESGGYGVGVPAGQIVVWDAEPGVVVRPYWLAPWRNRHYFPSNGEMPEIGRDENLKARSEPTLAEGYRRYWSTAPSYREEYPRARAPRVDIDPEIPEPSLK